MSSSADAQLVQLILDESSRTPLANRYGNVRSVIRSDGAPAGGAFSLILRATDTAQNKDVVLKVLRPNTDAYRVQSFEREARVLGALIGHEHILQLSGSIESIAISLRSDAGLSFPLSIRFFATEVAKENLTEFLVGRVRPRTLHRRLEVMQDIAKGVSRLHRAGYCHRDIKPDNILLFTGGRAKLGDLGTCRLSNGNDPLVSDYHMPVGDLRYAAPEMFSSGGMLPELYGGADWFGVGAILFEAVTSQNLYVAIGLHRLEDIKRTIAAAANIDQYARQMATATSQYPIPSTADYAIERWLEPIGEETHNRLTSLIRDLCNFDFHRRETNGEAILRRLDICTRTARWDFERAQHRRRNQ